MKFLCTEVGMISREIIEDDETGIKHEEVKIGIALTSSGDTRPFQDTDLLDQIMNKLRAIGPTPKRRGGRKTMVKGLRVTQK